MNPMKRLLITILVLSFVAGEAPIARGQVAVVRRAVSEAAEAALSRGGRAATREGVEALASRVDRLARTYGDDVLVAVRRAGPQAVDVLESAGPHAQHALRQLARHGDSAMWAVSDPRRLRLIARYGDDAAEGLIKHRTVAGGVIQRHGAPAARAMSQVNGQNARRIAMMQRDGDLARAGKARELLEVIAQYGDRAAEFIWRNKGALAVTAVAVAFIKDPEPFIYGMRDLAEVAAKPAGDIGKAVASEAARQIPWNVLALFGSLVAGLWLTLRFRLWKRLWRRRSTTRSCTTPS